MKKAILTIATTFLLAIGLRAQTNSIYGLPFNESFESGLGDWTTIDLNGDGLNWWTTSPYYGTPPAAHVGNSFIGSSSFLSNDFTPDNLLVSPAIAVTDLAVLQWWHRSYTSGPYLAEHYSVYISTSNDSASILSTIPVYSTTLTSNGWEEAFADLSPYVGDTVYIAFRHHGCYGQWALLLDDIRIEANTGCINYVHNTSFTISDNEGITVSWSDNYSSAWAVYVDDSLCGTTTDSSYYIASHRDAAALIRGNSTVGIRTICGTGDTSQMIYFQPALDNASCGLFDLPFSENFEDYTTSFLNHPCWLGTIYMDYNYAYLSTRAIHFTNGQSITTPTFNAPGNRLQVSLWMKVRGNTDAYATISALSQNSLGEDTVFEILTVNRLPDEAWQQCVFTTDTLHCISPVALYFTMSGNLCVIDNLEVTQLPETYDTVPPSILLIYPSNSLALQDTVSINAIRNAGDTTGLTYTWSHTLPCTILSSGATQQLVYTAVGKDTVTVVATNLYGSDTDTCVITVGGEPHVTFEGYSSVSLDDTLTYTATLTAGISAGLTYTWHSNKVATGEADTMVNGNMLTIVYHTGGTDVITLVASTLLGSDSISRTIYVNSCSTINSFPFEESFEMGSSLDCWIRRLPAGTYPTAHLWHRTTWGVARHTGTWGMCSEGNSNGGPLESWLITPALQMPANADSMFLKFFVQFDYNANFAVLVSPTGNSDYSYFTDTLYNIAFEGEENNNQWDSLNFSLADYDGRRIRIAFIHYGIARRNLVGLDDVKIWSDSTYVPPMPDTVWRTVTLICDSTMGVVTGGGEVMDSSMVTLIADAFIGYAFDRWNDGDTNDHRQVFVVSDTSFTAFFRVVDDSVGIGDITVDGISIRSMGDCIVVKGANGEVRVYDIMGRLVGATKGEEVTLRVPTAGVYLVRLNNHTSKKVVVIR